MNKVKVITTIDNDSNDKKIIKDLIINGTNVIRINLSYASHEFCEDIIDKVHSINDELDTNVGIMLDLNGPVVRCNHLTNGNALYTTGDKIRIYMDNSIGDNTRFSVDYPLLIDKVRIDDIIELEDGLVTLKVYDKTMDALICEVINGGIVHENKHLVVLNEDLEIPFVRARDKEDIMFADKMNVDYISLAYVKSSENVMDVNDYLIGLGNDHIETISKIECAKALDDIDDIIKQSNGIMIDRGNLGLEIPIGRITAIQKMIIGKCHRLGKVNIIISDILASTQNSTLPSKSDVSDIVNAIMDGTDAIMLNSELPIGKTVIANLKILGQIIKDAEINIDYESLYDEALRTEDEDATGMIASSVVQSANKLKCKAIIIPSMSGYTARKISRFRPTCPIIVVSPNKNTIRSLSLHFGVTALLIDELNSLDKIIRAAKKATSQLINVAEGDKIIITGGYPFKDVKSTNFMEIEEL